MVQTIHLVFASTLALALPIASIAQDDSDGRYKTTTSFSCKAACPIDSDLDDCTKIVVAGVPSDELETVKKAAVAECKANKIKICEAKCDAAPASISPKGSASDISWLRDRLTEISAVDKGILKTQEGMKLDIALKQIEDFQIAQKDFSGAVTLALKNDDSDNRDSYVIDGGFSVQRGTFPSQLSATSQVSVKSGSDNIREELSTLRVTYDRYLDLFDIGKPKDKTLDYREQRFRELVPLYEAFVFGERFTDEFMSISQRYEIGIGGKFEWNISDFRVGASVNNFNISQPGRLLDRLDSRDSLDHAFGFSVTDWGNADPAVKTEMDTNLARRNELIETLARVHESNFKGTNCGKDPGPVSCAQDIANHIENIRSYIHDDDNVRDGLFRQTSRLQFGISASLLGEFEQAAVEVRGPAPTGDEEQLKRTVTLADTRTTRLSVRPSMLFRFNENINLNGAYFWKPAIDSIKLSGSKDLREEWHFSLSYSLDKVTVSLNYDKYSDNDPPVPSCSQLQEFAEIAALLDATCSDRTTVLTVDRGARQHEIVSMKVSLPIN